MQPEDWDETLKREEDALRERFSALLKTLPPGDDDFLTLKAHLLVEVALRELLATRLAIDEARLPRLTFSVLAELALTGVPLSPESEAQVRQRTRLLNEVRNALAHTLVPQDQSRRIHEFVVLAGGDSEWPSGGVERMLAYHGAIANLVGWINSLSHTIRTVQGPLVHRLRYRERQ